MFGEFFQKLRQKIDKNCIFLTKLFNDLNYAENGDLTWIKQEGGLKYQQILSFAIIKWSFVPSLEFEKPKVSRKNFFRQSCAKNMGKIAQVKERL